jgi:DNA-binding transcriptional ArsR family regulator
MKQFVHRAGRQRHAVLNSPGQESKKAARKSIGNGAKIFLFAERERRAYIFNQMVKYSPQVLNRTFAALADPTRRRILAHLARGDKCVTHLARPHAMSLPAVSKHLRVLEKAGLLRRRRYGRVHEMQLEAKPLKQAAQWVEEYRKFWEGSLDRLADYLEKTTKQPQKKGTK